MEFQIDRQTIDDLNLFKGSKNSPSVFDLFNKVKTLGGRGRLKQIMEAPSINKDELCRRVESIRFFIDHEFDIAIQNQQLDFIDHYLNSSYLILNNTRIDIAVQKLKNATSRQESYYVISTGIKYAFYALKNVLSFAEEIKKHDPPEYLASLVSQVVKFSSLKLIHKVFKKVDLSKRENETELSAKEIFEYDQLFRGRHRENLDLILEIIFEFDVFLSISKVARERSFSLPHFLESENCILKIDEFFHPFIDGPVKNDIDIGKENICFLTGPNMAGKSTLLKSISLSIYLAHIGLPVPAKRYESSIFNGLMTTINLSDNLNMGYSHFLSEVKRVKEAVQKIKGKSKYFIIFDELFKGTNVMDAYEASVLIIKALTNVEHSAFIISTHLIEIANELKAYENISFKYLGVKIEDSMPKFSYKLCEGISKDRLGMIIVKNEGILDILDEIKEKK